MMYKIILGKNEIVIDEEDKSKIINNIDKNFIILKSGELVNPSFIQGVFIDHEATREKNKQFKIEENSKMISAPKQQVVNIKEILEKYKYKK